MEMVNGLMHSFIFIGPDGALVEGVRRIYRWEDGLIELLAERRLTLTGSGLRVEHKSMDTLLIKGRIDNISFEKRRRGER